MFFIGLSISLMLILIGAILLFEASYVLGGILLAIGILSLILLVIYYRSSRKRNFDCGCDNIDCGTLAYFTDCDCVGRRKGPDCDCDCDFCSPN